MRNLRYLLRNRKGVALAELSLLSLLFIALVGVIAFMSGENVNKAEAKYSLTPAARVALERSGSDPSAAPQIVASDASAEFGWLFNEGTQVVALEGALDSALESKGGPLICVGPGTNPESYRLNGQVGSFVGVEGYRLQLVKFGDKSPIKDQLLDLCRLHLK